MERMSVTQAVRQFSDVLNRVFYQKTVIELERGSKVIARISPVVSDSPVKVKDLNEFFAGLPALGTDAKAFANELADIRKELPAERNRWD